MLENYLPTVNALGISQKFPLLCMLRLFPIMLDYANSIITAVSYVYTHN